ncbi:unnamed protein product [Larinioides sclopetarius]|uniref:Uncharacterized protein n=1 Tax=Larinioides sclopetarius TaxID=280406 RepID=A0AAV2AD45_9ARAC
MSDGSFGQSILFAKDMMKYFMNKFRVDWTPGINDHGWERHSRRFTEAMGFVAWELVNLKIDDRPEECNVRFNALSGYKPQFRRGYNPEDFLHFCGILGWSMVEPGRDGQHQQVDGAVLTILAYLGEIHRDGSFPAMGGWELLANYAGETQGQMKARNFAERLLFAEDLLMYFTRRAGVEWTPPASSQPWQSHRRRFNETIGIVAWYHAHRPMGAWRFCIRENRLELTREYNPQDFLQYCGMMAVGLIRGILHRNRDLSIYLICDIIGLLEDMHENGSYPAWRGLERFARLFRDSLIRVENEHCDICRLRAELELALTL